MVRWGLGVVVAVACGAGCGGGGPASELAKPPEFNPPGQAKCRVQKSQNKPLVVEWTSGDRAELEARTQTGLVVIRYQGCELKILPECRAKGGYLYQTVTPKTDTLTIRDEDELFASLPVGAAGLEGTLKRAGQLNVSMTTVGRYVSFPSAVYRNELEGDCAGATHVIAGYSVGAFEMFSGADATVSGGASVLGVGAGARNRAERSTLTADGDRSACSNAPSGAPPSGCGAIIRLETSELLKEGQLRSTHSANSRIGTWVATEFNCMGVDIQTHGLRQTIVVGKSEMTATISTKDCTVTNSHVPIRGDDAAVGAGQISCSPSPCTLSYKMTATDGSSSEFKKICPDELPIVMPVRLSGSGDRLLLWTGDANHLCNQVFVRQGDAPTASATPEPRDVPEARPKRSLAKPGRAAPTASPKSQTPSYVLAGVGAAGLTASLVTGGMALGKKSTVDSECDGASRTCTQEGLDAARSGRTLSTVSSVSFGVGIIALGAAIYLMLDSDETPNVGLLRGPGPRGRASTFNGVNW